MTLNEEFKEINGLPKLSKWEEYANDCKGTQERVLMEILNASADSEIGIENDFKSIKCVEEFVERMPITEYKDYDERIERMALAEENILFPGVAKSFLSTSGTTGKSKKIPESELSSIAKFNVVKLRSANYRKIMMNHPKFKSWQIRCGIDPDNMTNEDFLRHYRFFSIASSTINRKTEGGIEIGYASGSTLDNSGVVANVAYPVFLQKIKDAEAVNYLTMLFGMRDDKVIMITGNNSARFKVRIDYAKDNAQMLIDDMRNGTISDKIKLEPEEREQVEKALTPMPERADELQKILDSGKENFIPKNYWPYVLVCCFWLSGTLGITIKDLYPLMPDDVQYMDIGYGASEAKINVPYIAGAKDGTLATTGAFYEFKDMDSGVIYTADKVEPLKEYDLIVTTYGGFFRYDMHDIVRVNGFYGNTPDIEFVTKAGEVLNVAQEKLPAATVVGYLKEYLNSVGVELIQAQIYQNMEDVRYDVYIECDCGDISRAQDIASGFDALLREKLELYGRVRNFNYLKEPKVYIMKAGWQSDMIAKKLAEGAPLAQIKIKSLIEIRPDKKWCC